MPALVLDWSIHPWRQECATAFCRWGCHKSLLLTGFPASYLAPSNHFFTQCSRCFFDRFCDFESLKVPCWVLRPKIILPPFFYAALAPPLLMGYPPCLLRGPSRSLHSAWNFPLLNSCIGGTFRCQLTCGFSSVIPLLTVHYLTSPSCYFFIMACCFFFFSSDPLALNLVCGMYIFSRISNCYGTISREEFLLSKELLWS